MSDSTTLARQTDTRAVAPQERLTLDMVCEMTGYEPMQVALVARTVAKDAPLQELAVFLHACRTLRLDPLLKQAYWIRRKSREQVNGEWQDVYKGTLQVGIDGFRALANEQGNYAGSQPPVFYDYQEIDGIDKGRAARIIVPGRCQVSVFKVVGNRTGCFTGEAYWDEFYPGPGTNGKMWRQMPRLMLSKCAEAQALRKGWPALLGPLQLAGEEADGLEVDSAPIGMPTITVTPAETPQRTRPSATAADYDRMFPDDEPTPVVAEAPQAEPEPEPVAVDARNRRDKAEDRATAKRQDAVL